MSERNMSMDAYVCIDGIICTLPEDRIYKNAQPIMENIAKINKLFYEGWHIICWTSRGHHTGMDHSNLTMRQLDEWGVKYDQLKMGKPNWGLIIDPNSKTIGELKS